ncbi:hypothetical protein TanjilG_32651 [Lupinus angustifolius]|uniref:Beta-Casp domain-containing protein n=1 Tax=Lupinus angustifolius TaxID=3871 RepID=A0A394DHL8_LUPAN|nr:hypothetical protein TanjilG_32651 [Lupinus angustifolius]
MSFQNFDEFNLNSDENLEEKEKLIFISSCAIECVKGGGSVLIPVNRLGTILQLLEEIATSLDASALKIPVYIFSSVAEELLAFLNIIPEWLCKQRQERLFAGELLFAYVKLLKEKRIHVVPAIHAHKLLNHALYFVVTGVCVLVLLFICFDVGVGIQNLYLSLRMC